MVPAQLLVQQAHNQHLPIVPGATEVAEIKAYHRQKLVF